tara:strand:- start:4492 stop:6390 length:1899 start_codon:yes stop_codon:yes gene_type:complete
MKVSYKHLIRSLKDKPSIEDLSIKLFQLGHEHEIEDDIFDIEITPNRGDCLSLNGILRELSIFFKLNSDSEIYNNKIDELKINFENKSVDICPKISFLKIEITDFAKNYKSYLESYFNDLSNNKVNFFTDISNYLSYEFGQPTHCYDFDKIKGKLSLEKNDKDLSFETLLNQKLNLKSENDDHLFYLDGNPINLAGVIGGKTSACSQETKTVLVECAFFEPEAIIGRTIKYDVQSEAAYKFERGVDHNCHDTVLRRFIKIVQDHAVISSMSIKSFNYKDIVTKKISYNSEEVDSIIGYITPTQLKESYLNKLGFEIVKNKIKIPSYRTDINHLNDIAEEIARVIGYDNIPSKKFEIKSNNYLSKQSIEDKIKAFLVNKGFSDVINFPFTNNHGKDSILVDNPLDSNRPYMRTTLKDSLIENLLYNERRQKDSIKIFEISDVYLSDQSSKKVLGIIGTGRLGKNYRDFSKKIDQNFLEDILRDMNLVKEANVIQINRNELDTKIKSPIFYSEIDICDIENIICDGVSTYKDFVKYKKISEYPSTFRDISFAVKDASKINELEKIFYNISDNNVKDVFVFDYYENKKIGVTKIGFRIVFQSYNKTLTDIEVEDFMETIIANSLRIQSVQIPGLN